MHTLSITLHDYTNISGRNGIHEVFSNTSSIFYHSVDNVGNSRQVDDTLKQVMTTAGVTYFAT